MVEKVNPVAVVGTALICAATCVPIGICCVLEHIFIPVPTPAYAAWGLGMFLGTTIPLSLGILGADNDILWYYLGVAVITCVFSFAFGIDCALVNGVTGHMSLSSLGMLMIMSGAFGVGACLGSN